MSDLKMTNAREYMDSGVMTTTGNDCSLSFGPKLSGYWIIGGSLYVYVLEEKTPTPEQIKNTEEMLGWEWKSNET